MKIQHYNSVCAVIVAYNDYEALCVNVESLSGQVDTIIIIDNSDEGIKLPNVIFENPVVIYKHSSSNQGLASGLNSGLKIAKKLNFEWILMLDQDSVVVGDMVGCMLNEYSHHPDVLRVGMICPDVLLSDKNQHQSPLQFGYVIVRKIQGTSADVDFSITSGSMIKASLLDEIGFMDETFFIEYIDFDYCLKLRSSGYKILFVKDAVLMHRLGERRRSYIGILYTYHPPQRVYYQTRNRLIVIKKYGLHYPSFAIIQVSFFVLKFFKILVIEDQKIDRLKFYFTGILKACGQQKNLNVK